MEQGLRRAMRSSPGSSPCSCAPFASTSGRTLAASSIGRRSWRAQPGAWVRGRRAARRPLHAARAAPLHDRRSTAGPRRAPVSARMAATQPPGFNVRGGGVGRAAAATLHARERRTRKPLTRNTLARLCSAALPRPARAPDQQQGPDHMRSIRRGPRQRAWRVQRILGGQRRRARRAAAAGPPSRQHQPRRQPASQRY